MTITDRRRADVAETVSRRGLLAPLAAATVVAASVTYVAARNPFTSTTLPPCAFHAATGLWCPGCGGTRALYSLLHGDVATALQMNAFSTLFFVPPMVLGLVWWLARAFGVRVPTPRISTRYVWAYVAVLGVFSVVRNLPGFDFLHP